MFHRVFFPKIIMATLFFTVGCSTGSKDKPMAYSHFKIGVSFVAKGKHEKGLRHLLKANNLDTGNPLYLNHLGLTYFFMGEYELAIDSLRQALRERPKYSEAHNNIGRAYIEIKDFKTARKHLSEASADLTYPHKDKVWFNFGLSYFMQNQYPKSQTYFLRAISANRSNCLAYNYYGRSAIEMEKFKKAAKALDQAIYHCRRQGLDEPHYFSAIALFRTGYKSKAMARLKEGLSLFPRGAYRKKMAEMMKLMALTEAK